MPRRTPSKERKSFTGHQGGPGSGNDFDADLARIRALPAVRKLYEQVEAAKAHAPQNGNPVQVAELRRVRQVVAAMLARIDLELKAARKRTA